MSRMLDRRFETYCSKCLKKLFSGNKISQILSFTIPEFNKIKVDTKGM